MKAKVLIPFFDKHAKKERKSGDIFDVAASRFNDIIRKGRYIEAVEETKAGGKRNEEK